METDREVSYGGHEHDDETDDDEPMPAASLEFPGWQLASW